MQTAQMLDHISLQSDDMAKTSAFYDAVLAPLGGKRIMDFGEVIGYGTGQPTFWIGTNLDPPPQRQVHVAFSAKDRASVDAFFEAATALGAEVIQAPRVCPEYHENYYGAFVRDPEGNNVEAVCHAREEG